MKSLQIDDRIDSLIHELNFKDAREVIKDSLITEILGRISRFAGETERFEAKYRKAFQEFKKEYESGNEDFEKCDDLMAWEFAKQGREYWEKKLEELKSVL